MKYVIRAGGVGTRLWPFSRSHRPKQFHALAGPRTMLQEAVDRLRPLAPMEDVYVSTSAALAELVCQQVPDLARDRLILEPALRNTGPAVGLECVLLEARHPGCVVASLGSDHYIGKEEEFRRLLSAAGAAAEQLPEYLFTVGVRPTRAETGYGYIRKGPLVARAAGEPVYQVAQFTEKPDARRAAEYAASGEFLWNSNIFVWRARRVLELLAGYEPELHAGLMRIARAAGTPAEEAAIAREYPALKSIAVDHALLERSGQVATLEADIGWGDIGSWAALTDVLAADAAGNLLSGQVLLLDSRAVTAYGPPDKLIALIGVEDLVVVDTQDALLVCRKDQCQRVKEVLERLRDQPGFHRYT